MPTYTFLNKDTQKEHTEFMKISEMETFLNENPNYVLVPSAPGISYNDLKKPSDHFRDRLREIKKTHVGNKINIW